MKAGDGFVVREWALLAYNIIFPSYPFCLSLLLIFFFFCFLFSFFVCLTFIAGSGENLQQEGEFAALLAHVLTFNKAWKMFSRMDANFDRRLTEEEFKKGAMYMGIYLNAAEAATEFKTVCAHAPSLS